MLEQFDPCNPMYWADTAINLLMEIENALCNEENPIGPEDLLCKQLAKAYESGFQDAKLTYEQP